MPDHAAFRVVPFVVETCGYVGKEAVRWGHHSQEWAHSQAWICAADNAAAASEFGLPEWAYHLKWAVFAS